MKDPSLARAIDWFFDHMKLPFLPALTFSQHLTITVVTLAVTAVNTLGWWLDWWPVNEVSAACTFVFVLLMLTRVQPPRPPRPPSYDPMLPHAENARRMLAWMEATPEIGHSPEVIRSLREIIEIAEEEDSRR
jgi:hypothetical protein